MKGATPRERPRVVERHTQDSLNLHRSFGRGSRKRKDDSGGCGGDGRADRWLGGMEQLSCHEMAAAWVVDGVTGRRLFGRGRAD